MKQLLEIKSVPIVLEYKVSNAKFQQADSVAVAEFSANRGAYRMRVRPIRMNVDTLRSDRAGTPRAESSDSSAAYERQSAGIASALPRRSAASASYRATAHMLDNGSLQVEMRFDSEAVRQISSQMTMALQAAEYVPDYPDTPHISRDLSVTYELDKMQFDWTASEKNIELEFIPADIEFSIAEYPSVSIKYVGDPIYVPPSVNPNYEPIDAIV